MMVDATFALDRPWTGGTIKVCVTDASGMLDSDPTDPVIQWTDATISPPGSYYSTWTASITGVVAVKAFPNCVADFQMKLNWYATLVGMTASTPVGASTDEVYLSYDTPYKTSEYNTVVYLGCHNAQGDTVQSDVALDIWNNAFSKNTLQTKEGTALFVL